MSSLYSDNASSKLGIEPTRPSRCQDEIARVKGRGLRDSTTADPTLRLLEAQPWNDQASMRTKSGPHPIVKSEAPARVHAGLAAAHQSDKPLEIMERKKPRARRSAIGRNSSLLPIIRSGSGDL